MERYALLIGKVVMLLCPSSVLSIPDRATGPLKTFFIRAAYKPSCASVVLAIGSSGNKSIGTSRSFVYHWSAKSYDNVSQFSKPGLGAVCAVPLKETLSTFSQLCW